MKGGEGGIEAVGHRQHVLPYHLRRRKVHVKAVPTPRQRSSHLLLFIEHFVEAHTTPAIQNSSHLPENLLLNDHHYFFSMGTDAGSILRFQPSGYLFVCILERELGRSLANPVTYIQKST